MRYNPKQRWEKLALDRVKAGIQSKRGDVDEIEYLASLILQHKKEIQLILDVGSGFGFVYQYLKEHNILSATSYTMVDFVNEVRTACQKEIGILPDYWDGKTLQYDTNYFDLVISHTVLLHVQPSIIARVISEHARVTRKYIYVATYIGNKELAYWNFKHDYLSLFEKNKLKIIESHIPQIKGRINWLLEKENS